MSTRAVTAAAHIQVPAIYRLFALTDHERGLMHEWLNRITGMDRPRR